ncbi:PaREP1 family protein [Acidianus sp. HS-5]|uniref:PaREP1 family protein n=1 Tax=Acidianus sp. HS-5 TaxID=2886040 RepID=UPI001F16BC0F|nr:PaREP1 family protein [Acidianus sp. HS-5]BDC17761.1 hypothetical protein HS5_06510 [Acidianus sp. HS-5]
MSIPLSETYLKEADEFLAKGDTVQASEKYYKAAEEALKLLMIKNNVNVLKEAEEKGKWDLNLLNEAVDELAKIYGEEIIADWAAAVSLITAKLAPNVISELSNYVRHIVSIASTKD